MNVIIFQTVEGAAEFAGKLEALIEGTVDVAD